MMKQEDSRTCLPVPGGATDFSYCTVLYSILAAVPPRTERTLRLLLFPWCYLCITWKFFAKRTNSLCVMKLQSLKTNKKTFAASTNLCNVLSIKEEMHTWWFQDLQIFVISSEYLWYFPKKLQRKMSHMSRPTNSGDVGISGDSENRC